MGMTLTSLKSNIPNALKKNIDLQGVSLIQASSIAELQKVPSSALLLVRNDFGIRENSKKAPLRIK